MKLSEIIRALEESKEVEIVNAKNSTTFVSVGHAIRYESINPGLLASSQVTIIKRQKYTITIDGEFPLSLIDRLENMVGDGMDFTSPVRSLVMQLIHRAYTPHGIASIGQHPYAHFRIDYHD